MTPSHLRELMPATRDAACLIAAAVSPLPTPVAKAAQAVLDDSLAGRDGFWRWLANKELLRARIGRLLGVPQAQVAFTASTSMGFHATAELWWRKGIREVLTLDAEFPSTTVPLLHRGLTLNVVKASPDGAYPIEALERALRPSTRAVAVSAVQFASGFRIDLEGLGQLCRAKGLSLAVNVAQAVGQIPLSLDAIGADFACGTSHKWLMGGFGVGLYYCRAGWLEEFGLPWAGWFGTPEAGRWEAFYGAQQQPTDSGFIAHGVQTVQTPAGLEGSIAWSSVESLAAAAELVEQLGLPAIEAHNRALQRSLRAQLRRRGFQPNAPDEQVAGTCVVPVAGDLNAVVAGLAAERVFTTPRRGLRIATHVFNDASDLERLFAAFDKLNIRPG